MSATYLKWAEENHAVNGFNKDETVSFIRANVVELLDRPHRFDVDKGFDIIFLDPPSFSNSSKMQDTLDIQRDHDSLIDNAMKLINKGGVLVFSTNRKGFKLAENCLSTYAITDITRETVSEDFKRRPHIHKCWEIRQRA